MTENEKICMAEAMRNFQKAKEDPEALWNELLDAAADTLEKLVAALKVTSEFQAADEEDNDTDECYDEEAIVLYAAPGEPLSLMEEGDALDEFVIADHEDLVSFEWITETLQLGFPADSVVKDKDGRIAVAGPVYVCHPVGLSACADLSVVELMKAIAYLAAHQVKISKDEKTVYGYLLNKED